MINLFYLILLFSYIFYIPLISANISEANLSGQPIVVLHGVASSAPNMNDFSAWLETTFNTKVFNIELGNGFKTSLYSPLTAQLNELCSTIYAIEALKDGFNLQLSP